METQNTQTRTLELRVQIYRAGTGAIILDEQNRVLLFSRIDGLGWQFPQGGLDLGETAEEGVMREIGEETGLTERELEQLPIPPKNTSYVIPQTRLDMEPGNRFRGQAHTWFFFRFIGREEQITLGHALEFSDWKWTTMEEAVEAVKDFKQDVYRDIAHHLKKYV